MQNKRRRIEINKKYEMITFCFIVQNVFVDLSRKNRLVAFRVLVVLLAVVLARLLVDQVVATRHLARIDLVRG